MTLDIHNWSSSAHQEIHKIIKDEILPIVNQVDARVQNFEIQFLKEAAKFVRDFKSLAKEDESLTKHKALELEIKRLLRAVVSQDIMFIVQSNSVIDTSNLQTELERMKERFENSYNDMQQKIERLQAQLGDQKGKSKDTLCVSNTLDPLSQKLENENVELEFQGLPKIDETHALSKLVTSNSVPTPQETKVVKNDNVIAPGLFRINPFKPSREEKSVPNKVRVSIRTNPITVSQPHVITKKGVNSNLNCLSSTGVDNTAKTKRPQPRRNTKSDRIPSASKSSCIKNKEYVNGMKSRKKNQSANVSKSANQKKHKPKVWKPKRVGSKEILASPKPSTYRSCLKWSPTGRMFDLKGKIIAISESVYQSDCSKGCQNWFDTLLIPLLFEYKSKDKETHGDNECDN
ncbi:hypothetical protein Tco_1029807 [Tanacetum coccineum]|uniref:Uncharacterized protein n=1 Tax=Tanacetum coccineum TaxID=301880 RepID=A0ABQ5G4Q5_9ASTR